MNPTLTPSDEKKIEEIVLLFQKAEAAIKKVEVTQSELIVPAVNQLRYAGCHLIRYLKNSEDNDQLNDVVRHCKRSAYDAFEAGIVFSILEYRKFQGDYSKVIIADVVSNYSELQINVDEAIEFISKIKKDSRDDHYKECEKSHEIVSETLKKLNSSRNELNKLIKKDRNKFYLFVFAAISALGGLFYIFTQFLEGIKKVMV